MVDAVDFAPVFYVATGANKSAPVFVTTRHTYNVGAVIVSSKAWTGLSDGHKKILKDAMVALDFPTTAAQVDMFEAKMLGIHQAKGGTVVELTDEECAVWKKAGLAS